MTEHTVTITLLRAWNEYRPQCTCGWTGSYWPKNSQAVLDGQQHVNAESDHDR